MSKGKAIFGLTSANDSPPGEYFGELLTDNKDVCESVARAVEKSMGIGRPDLCCWYYIFNGVNNER